MRDALIFKQPYSMLWPLQQQQQQVYSPLAAAGRRGGLRLNSGGGVLLAKQRVDAQRLPAAGGGRAHSRAL